MARLVNHFKKIERDKGMAILAASSELKEETAETSTRLFLVHVLFRHAAVASIR
jgi:hypothetical protein